MLSRAARYGIHALMALADAGPSAQRRTTDLARATGAPSEFLANILRDLARHGIVVGRRGRGGGYSLTRPADEIAVGEILRALDGPLAPLPCVSRTAYRPCDECPSEEECALRPVMQQVRDASAAVLDGTTLADLHAPARPGRSRRPRGGR